MIGKLKAAHHFLLIPAFWVVSMISPFIMLTLVWAIIAHVFNFVILPLFTILLFGIPIKFLIYKGYKSLSDVTEGIFEVIITTLIDLYKATPDNFILVVLYINIANQFVRYERNKNQDELRKFYGLIIGSLIYILVKNFLYG